MTSNRMHRIQDRNAQALEFAERNRQFEIGLYWKRSAYFWTFTALAFAGYGALQTHCCDLDDRETLSFLLANIGCVASFAWFLANKGSKFWQEQWETHVDVLEDRAIGTVYKKWFVRTPISKSYKLTRLDHCRIQPKKQILGYQDQSNRQSLRSVYLDHSHC